jgi:nicotinamidase-related amidase
MQTQRLADTIPPLEFRDRSQTALLVIDVQYSDAAAGRGWVKACETVEPGSMAYYVERLETVTIPAIQTLLEAFRREGRPVIHLALGSGHQDLRDCPPRFREWTRALESAAGVRDMWWAGNPDFAFREEVRPLADETVIRKTTQGAFNGSEIDAVLQRMGIRNLVCTGVVTSCCVETTARDAADRGYGCLVVSEACADCDQDLHDSALRNFGLYFGKTTERAEDAIALLSAS